MPAEAGIQKALIFLGSRLRGNDDQVVIQSIHRNTRRALMHRFPFGVYYRIENATCVVLAVMHGSRNPRQWKIRT